MKNKSVCFSLTSITSSTEELAFILRQSTSVPKLRNFSAVCLTNCFVFILWSILILAFPLTITSVVSWPSDNTHCKNVYNILYSKIKHIYNTFIKTLTCLPLCNHQNFHPWQPLLQCIGSGDNIFLPPNQELDVAI